ncbi:MAG: peptide-methionine (S)-S-oxide reductase, partial [Candidatus Nitrosopolaris sp.]
MTQITPFKDFYVAEDYHKNYYESHRDAPYCNFV